MAKWRDGNRKLVTARLQIYSATNILIPRRRSNLRGSAFIVHFPMTRVTIFTIPPVMCVCAILAGTEKNK